MKLGLGTVQFGLNYGISNSSGIISDNDIEKVFETISKNGISYIDTAQAYGNAEKRIGRFDLTNYKVISKINKSLKSNEIEKHFLTSLDNLGLNKLYGLLVHDFNHFKFDNSIYHEIKKLKNMGYLEKIGFSLYETNELNYLLKNKIEFDILQIPYSIFDQRFSDLLDTLKLNKVEIHARSIFLQGLVFLNPESLSNYFDPIKNHLKKFREETYKNGISIESACLNFVCQDKRIDCALIGINKFKELVNILDSYDEKISTTVFKKFEIEDNNLLNPSKWK
tara:strand:- start:6536 stop:7375 length:840 start_codon:yes stop_codon:yes gene_type:complete